MMAFKKTFNRSERAALLALGELFKQGLVGQEVFDFQTVGATIVTVQKEAGVNWLTRSIIFTKEHLATSVTVRTPEGQGYSEKHQNEGIFWDAVDVGILERGDVIKIFNKTRYPDHTYWSRGAW